ncbi:DUF3310 domain-containing protein [uncultured Stutzerimonas sp.]|uniref:DUF3310 domain-containing protein n=1 Tax=uncultured Stutzerimonas sp. TaxID=2901168 RepID=UPI0032B16A4B|tara:strand:- start:2977 stop:3873 length:897 start_codon:yes stop_codon:yes gene_type:complete
MSAYSLTAGSTAALRLIASMGGTEILLLIQPARELRPEITIEPLGTLVGGPLEAVVYLANQRHSMTLQRGDSANAQHLADWVEAIANGTLDTAEVAPQRSAVLLPCCRCEGEAIGYDYALRSGDAFLHGVKCRYSACQSLEGADTAEAARNAWNDLQRNKLDEEPSPTADMVNHPPHYTGHPSGVECIEVAEYLPFCLGNAFKYLFRRDAKGNPVENIEKAIWYVNRHNETYPNKPELPTDAREALGEIVVHEPHPFGACMLIIAGPEQCGAYDTCLEMLKSEAERLRWIAQHDAAAA